MISKSHRYIRKLLLLYDVLAFIVIAGIYLLRHPGSNEPIAIGTAICEIVVCGVIVIVLRLITGVYGQIWRYGGVDAYIRLIIADVIAGIVYTFGGRFIGPALHLGGLNFNSRLVIVCLNLLAAITMRLVYSFLYREVKVSGSPAVRRAFSAVTGVEVKSRYEIPTERKINVAILGAGNVGTLLAQELLNNKESVYLPVCFVENDKSKLGREIFGIPVIEENDTVIKYMRDLGVQEVIFTMRSGGQETLELYEGFRREGFIVKKYDYPVLGDAAGSRRSIREYAIEELLLRNTENVLDDRTVDYYKGKTVMITGGGGSIGSELCRIIAAMAPREIVIVDSAENGSYEVQQELRFKHPDVKLTVEILSICDSAELDKAVRRHSPEIILHAAAHKHVPLMERNVCEAVRNNVFGTENLLNIAEDAGVGRFIMISTDKAVNPTSVMGATKRICEMITLSHRGHMVCSATRFGNVLGSAGSVIPLFKKQIAAGGPVTVTDKNITRYFMTINEACQLVLKSGMIAAHGELMVLDMGQPVKIIELAENMIRLSGFKPYDEIDIKETGLRPGEKLYEELLITGESQDKTEDDKIFIERDVKMSEDEIADKLRRLSRALETNDDETVRTAIEQAVPTYHYTANA